MPIARVLAALLLACLVTEAACQAQFIVNTGDGTCSSVGFNECVPCTTASGEAASTQGRQYLYGKVQCYVFNSTDCEGHVGEFWAFPSVCEELAPCQIAPSTFSSFYVASSEQIKLINLPSYGSWGITYMNQTNAVTAGTLEYQLFEDENGSILRLVKQFDDGSYATNIGLCDLDVWCHVGNWSYMLTTRSLPDMYASSHAEKMVADAILGRVTEPLLEFDFRFAMSATSGNLFIHSDDVITVPASTLGNVIATVPPNVRLLDMELKDADLAHPSLLALLDINDFDTYVVGDCDQKTRTDQPFGNSDVVNCEFSFLESITEVLFHHLHPSFSENESAYDSEYDLAWEERPTFSLFD